MKILLKYTLFTSLLTFRSVVAFGQDSSKVIHNQQGNYPILDSANIEFISKKDTWTSAELVNHELLELNSLITEFIGRTNKSIEPEVEREIRRNPRHAEMIKNSKYLHQPDDYFYQLVLMRIDRGHKLVWVNGIHSSSIDKNKDLKSLVKTEN